MKNIMGERFKVDYENDSTASYLVLNITSNEEILEYQIEMLNNNSSQGILKFDTRQKNDEVRLYYNITSTLTLSQLLQRKNLKEEEFINILKGIIKPLLTSKEYFLYDNSFIIDEDYIYINPSTLEISMIYIPLALDIDTGISFKNFLIDLIISLAKIDENSTENYMQRILNYLKNDIFNISDFDNFLRNLKKDTHKEREDRTLQPRKSRINIESTHSSLVGKNGKIKESYESYEWKKEINPIQHQRRKCESISIEKEEEVETIIKTKYETRYIVIAVLAQIIMAIAITFGLDTIKATAGDAISAYGGIAIVVVAINILLFRNLFKKENMKEVRVTKKEKGRKKNINNGRETGKSKPQPTIYQEKESLNMSKREIYNINEPSIVNESYKEAAASKEVDIIPTNMNETVILDDEKQGIAYLQRMSNGMVDKVAITKSNFIIGRLPNYVDYLLESNAIGRAHAEILQREGQYFIKDLNSKNGTFINGFKIHSNKEYEINNEDKVKFADIEYIFIEA